jgi:hypothetical protein
MDMRSGTWNVRSMHRAGSLRAVVEEISKYKSKKVKFSPLQALEALTVVRG